MLSSNILFSILIIFIIIIQLIDTKPLNDCFNGRDRNGRLCSDISSPQFNLSPGFQQNEQAINDALQKSLQASNDAFTKIGQNTQQFGQDVNHGLQNFEQGLEKTVDNARNDIAKMHAVEQQRIQNEAKGSGYSVINNVSIKTYFLTMISVIIVKLLVI